MDSARFENVHTFLKLRSQDVCPTVGACFERFSTVLKKFHRPKLGVNNLFILVFFAMLAASYFGMEFSYHGDRITLDIDAEVDEEFYEEQLSGAEASADDTHRDHGIRTMGTGMLGIIVMGVMGIRKRLTPEEYIETLSVDQFIDLYGKVTTKAVQYQATLNSAQEAQPVSQSYVAPVGAAQQRPTIQPYGSNSSQG